MTSATLEHLNFMVLGTLIILFLIAEPAGLARLWQIGKQKLQGVAFPVLKVHTRANSSARGGMPG